ncbi:MAG: hypothetical protein ACTSYQ_02300 [Candidatus Odinarchaeia archaeon]
MSYLINNSEDKKTQEWGQAFKYLGIGFDIIVFAIVGWIVAKSLGWNEILGIGIGAIVGTFIMYFHLYLVVKKFSSEKKVEK